MKNILDQLADYARERVKDASEKIPPEEMRRRAEERAAGEKKEEQDRFCRALSGPGMHFICECKKASPSKGLISEDFPYLKIAKAYDRGGASAISVLTEPKWFLGKNEYLEEIAGEVTIPVLRKDFTIDPYMIYEAKTLGASAILLICSLLDTGELKEYLAMASELGLSALVEAHDAEEIRSAVDAGAGIIGVNNRNLKDFTVDVGNAAALRNEIPENVVYISESGIKSPEDVKKLAEDGVNGVLIGEMLMRSKDPEAALLDLRRAAGLTV